MGKEDMELNQTYFKAHADSMLNCLEQEIKIIGGVICMELGKVLYSDHTDSWMQLDNKDGLYHLTGKYT